MSNANSIIGVIDRLRERVREVTSDTRFTDEFLYYILLDQRNILIHRELNKRNFRSEWTYKTYCMPLESSTDIPCDCIPKGLNCTALKSTYKLPRSISSNGMDTLIVTSLDGRNEYSYKKTKVGKFNKYTRLGKIKPYYTIYNEYLYIIGEPINNLPAVLIQMIPEDPVDFDEITICNEDNETTTCFDPITDTFNTPSSLNGVIIDMAYEKLLPSYQMPEDIKNDRNSTIDQLEM